MNYKQFKKQVSDYDFRKYLKYALRYPCKTKVVRPKQQIPPYLNFSGIESLLKSNTEQDTIALLGSGKLYKNNQKSSDTQWKIHLASVDMAINSFINWNMTFSDDEDMAAYHRFIWMYCELIKRLENGCSQKELKPQVEYFIKSWIDKYEKSEIQQLHPEIFQTYTVAERIVSWLYSLSIVSDENNLKDSKIYDSIKKQISYICCHLEYYGEKFTGNHLSNDGKALYIAGTMLGLKEVQKTGQIILRKELERLLVDGGFLREGSVHYQFLITKNYTDVFEVANEFHDIKFQEKLLPYLLKMTEACRYFLVYDNDQGWGFPLIGDISPDYRPEWLIGTPWATERVTGKKVQAGIPLSLGYHNIFFKEKNRKEIKATEMGKECFYKDLNDWGKITDKNWTAFTHINHSMYPNNLTGHFHHDTGALVLYFQGQRVLCDCGRITYELTERGLRDRRIEAHSGLRIDALEPEIDLRTFYSDSFLKEYTYKKPYIVNPDNTFMEIHQFGYERISQVGEIIRKVQLKNADIELQDTFEGTGKHTIELFFHTKMLMRVEHQNLILKNQKQEFSITFDKDFDEICLIHGSAVSIDGNGALSYGENENLHSAVCKIYVDFPHTITTRISRR